MGRGRPTRSVIRQNMVEIVSYLGSAHGYAIYKVYKEIFPKVTLRVMYYHLRKGVALGEFKEQKVTTESGQYSWGQSAERTYYSLGKNAHVTSDPAVKSYFAKK